MRNEILIKKDINSIKEIKKAIFKTYGGNTSSNLFDITIENIRIEAIKTYTYNNEYNLINYRIKRR